MRIVHTLNGKVIEKCLASEEEAKASFFLSNCQGGFAHFSTANSSKYQGFFAKVLGDVFKIVESLNPVANHSAQIKAVENSGFSAVFRHDTFDESFFVPRQRNCIVYELSAALPVELFFDIRKADDFRVWGRNYSVRQENDKTLLLSFIKRTDAKEDADATTDKLEFTLHVCVRHDGFVSGKLGEWTGRSYSLDRERNSESDRYVYKAATVTGKKFVICAASSPSEAVREADSVFISAERLKSESKRHYNGLCTFSSHNENKKKRELATAANAALVSLDKLSAGLCLYAGLPWFFQEWSRDELVSCVSFNAALKKKTVLKYFDKILSDGRLPAVYGAYKGACFSAGSADSEGWLFKRVSELFDDSMFTGPELKKLKAALKKSIDGVIKSHWRNGFIFSEKNETWMDTSFNDDGRQGACIEIQAMHLRMYNLMYWATREKTYMLLEHSLRQNVRRFFWNGSILADRLNDYTIRPNVFIAAYVYPQLLSKREWETCITNALSKLWLDWGGLATIDRSHPDFHQEYTGETNESYHRGDSWFWLNNIAAIVMRRVNSRKFKTYIEKIVAASAKDILWKGAVGCASELSSAKEQRAEGCLNQAWSNATFIELVKPV